MACSNQRFMAHFLGCDSILLVSVKVAFDLKRDSLNYSSILPFCFLCQYL